MLDSWRMKGTAMKLFGENGTWSRIFLFLWMSLFFILNLTNVKIEGSEKGLAILALCTAITILFGK